MSKSKTKSKTSQQPKRDAGPAVVLFGLGDGDKPRAAYFPAAQATLATKAAEAMKLYVLKVENPELKAMAAKLPTGRIHANGQGLVPFVRNELYVKLTGLAEPKKDEATPASTAAADASSEKAPKQAGAVKPAASSGALRLPHDWVHIEAGDLVVAQSADPDDGWWEAVVTGKNGDMLTLRWRDLPRQKAVVRHKLNLARLCPVMGADTAVHGSAPPSLAAASTAEQGPQQAAETGDGAERYPATWDDIRPDQVVVAKEDGPFQGWWEAIVTQANGDTLTLRWRNRPQLLPITRHRLHVALMLPKAA